jgi:hypothetical protein
MYRQLNLGSRWAEGWESWRSSGQEPVSLPVLPPDYSQPSDLQVLHLGFNQLQIKNIQKKKMVSVQNM